MFALLVVICVLSVRNIYQGLSGIADGQKEYIESIVVSASLLAFTIYAILNWI